MGQCVATSFVEPPQVADEVLDATVASTWPLTDAEAGCSLRWVVNVHHWQPTRVEWLFLQSLLPNADVLDVEKLHRIADRKRGLVSRLMQRRCVALTRGIDDQSVRIARTKGSKPFDAGSAPACDDDAPNFNFNVSHEGDYVVLASDPVLLIGIDVSAPFDRRDAGPPLGDSEQLRDIFSQLYSDAEWELVDAAGDEAARVKAFRRQWSRKESFVKARGDGLAFELSRCEFRPSHAPKAAVTIGKASSLAESRALALAPTPFLVAPLLSSAPLPSVACAVVARSAADDSPGVMLPRSVPDGWYWSLVHVDGESRAPWRCYTHELDDGHIISITRGPVALAEDSDGHFRASFQRPDISKDELRRRLAAAPLPLRQLQVRDLVPPSLRAVYDEIRAADPPLQELPSGRPIFVPAPRPTLPRRPEAKHEVVDGLWDVGAPQDPGWLHPGNRRGAGPPSYIGF